MTAPERSAAGLDANARGIIVIVVAVAVGLALLFNAGAGADDKASSPSPSIPGPTVEVGDTTTTVPGSGTTDPAGTDEETTTTAADGAARQPSEVSVVVLNGSGKNGAAGANSETLENAGFQMLEPGNPLANIDGNTVVYYAEGYEADAVAVASALGKAADVVEAKPETELGPGAADANVVVILGSADTSPVG